MRGRRARQVAALLLLAPRVAAAQVAVAVEVVGDCPSQQDVQAAASLWSVGAGANASAAQPWRLRVESATSVDVVVTVVAPDGHSVLERRLPSGDCAALARAADVIARTQLAELGLIAAEPTAQPAAEPAEPVATPRAAPPEPTQPSSTAQVATAAEPPPVRTRALRIGLGGGVGVAYAPARTAAALGSVDATFDGLPIQLRLSGSLSGPTTQRRGSDEVRHQEGRVFGLGLVRLSGASEGPWLEPGLGAGVVRSWARAVSLPDSQTVTSYNPAVIAVLGAGARLSGPICAKIELAGEVHLIRDRYVIVPDIVAHAPRGVVSLTLGLEARLDL